MMFGICLAAASGYAVFMAAFMIHCVALVIQGRRERGQ